MMCKHALLTTLIVITYSNQHHALTNVNNTMTSTSSRTTLDKLKFWDRDPKFWNARRNPDPQAQKWDLKGDQLEAFFRGQGNQSGQNNVYHYSDIQKRLNKSGYELRKVKDDLSVVLKNNKHKKEKSTSWPFGGFFDIINNKNNITKNLTVTTYPVANTTNAIEASMAANSSNETKNYSENNARRTKFDLLKFWERDPKFENNVQPVLFGRRISSHKKSKSTNGALNDYLRSKKSKRRRNLKRVVYYERLQDSRRKQRVDAYPKRSRRKFNLRRALTPLGLLKNNSSVLRADDSSTAVPEEKPKKEGSGTKLRMIEIDKTQLSPYSLLFQLNSSMLKQLQNLGADVGVNVTFEVLGRTVEYNDIIIIKATGTKDLKENFFRADDTVKFDESAPEKKIIFIVHGLATFGFNELPCLKTVVGFLKLMSFYYQHLDKFDIFVIPMANPDGVAVWKPLWNKNMAPQPACPGVALDRNFDVAWKTGPNTESSCSQQYSGPEPFSEPETQAIRDVFHKYSHRIVAYIHVHSATYARDIYKGDALLYPKGYTEKSSDDDKYVDLKGEIDEVMKNASFKVYSFTVDSLYNWYGKVTGTSVDYASTVYGIPFAMEYVMQLYEDDMMLEDSEERETAIVLNEVWARVINVSFNFIYKTTKTGVK